MTRTDLPGRIDRRTARTTAAILDAAEIVFRENGFHAARMDAIAAAADVAVGTIYFHFHNKEALYLALVERALDVNERYMAQAYPPDLTPLDQVIAAGEAYLRFHLEHPGYFRMIALRAFDLPPGDTLAEAERRIADRVELLVRAVEDALTRAAATGQVQVDDPHDASIFLWGAWNGVVALHLRSDRLRLDNTRVEEVLAAGRRIVTEGLLPRRS